MLSIAIFVAIAFPFIWGGSRILRRRRGDRALLASGPPVATDLVSVEALLAETAPAPAAPPSPFELAGVPFVRSEDRMGSWVYIAWNDREYALDRKDGTVDPALLGLFIAQGSERSHCTYCSSHVLMIAQVVKRTVPQGAVDLGLAERRAIGYYCGKCGLNQRIVTSPMVDPTPEPFRSGMNLFDALKALAADNGKLTKEIRYRMLEAEYARIQPEAARIADQMRYLHAELHPRTDLDPYRGTPLAKLEDPPDDRAKALPAIVERNGPWGETAND